MVKTSIRVSRNAWSKPLGITTGITQKEYFDYQLAKMERELNFWYVNKVGNFGMKFERTEKDSYILTDLYINITKSRVSKEPLSNPYYTIERLAERVGKHFTSGEFWEYTEFCLIAEDFDKPKASLRYDEFLRTQKPQRESNW